MTLTAVVFLMTDVRHLASCQHSSDGELPVLGMQGGEHTG
jgi:hypothetical protein